MFDAGQHHKLATWVNKNSKQLNDRLAKARSQEELRAVLADATAYVNELRSEREIHALALADARRLLEQDHAPQQQSTTRAETETELGQDAEIREQVVAELDRHIATCEAFIEWVQEELNRRSWGISGAAPKASLKISVLDYLKNLSKRKIISAGVGLAIVILAAGVLLAQPGSTQGTSAPTPAVVAKTPTAAMDAADLPAKVPEPTAAPKLAATLAPAATVEPTATPEIAATAEPTATPGSTASPESTATPEPAATPAAPIAADVANLRSGPGINYPIVDNVNAGQNLDVVARTAAGDWYKLRSGGWIAAFLVTNPPGEVPEATDIPAPPSAPATLAAPTPG